MGSVGIDLYKKEREYENLNLSDKEVVKYLILFRNKLDTTYDVGMNININQAGEFFDFNQELIVLYASLDDTIKQCEFDEKYIKFLDLIFIGNSIMDIVNHYNLPKKTAYRMLEKIVDDIVEQNGYNWKRCIYKQGYILRKNH